MTKMMGIHEIELRPGVTSESFERFLADHAWDTFGPPGVNMSFVRSPRDNRTGTFVMLQTFDDAATRNRFFPSTREHNREAQQWLESYTATWDRWNVLAKELAAISYTDYVVIDP